MAVMDEFQEQNSAVQQYKSPSQICKKHFDDWPNLNENIV